MHRRNNPVAMFKPHTFWKTYSSQCGHNVNTAPSREVSLLDISLRPLPPRVKRK